MTINISTDAEIIWQNPIFFQDKDPQQIEIEGNSSTW